MTSRARLAEDAARIFIQHFSGAADPSNGGPRIQPASGRKGGRGAASALASQPSERGEFLREFQIKLRRLSRRAHIGRCPELAEEPQRATAAAAAAAVEKEEAKKGGRCVRPVCRRADQTLTSPAAAPEVEHARA